MELVKRVLYQSEMELISDDKAFNIAPFVFLTLIFVLCWIWFKKKDKYYLLFSLLFGTYLLLSISQLFFPMTITGWYADMMREEATFRSKIIFLPLHLDKHFDMQSSLQTIYLNILLTIPFGFGINFFAKFHMKNMLVLSLTVGVIVETIQFVLSLVIGYPYRFIDINDVLFNAIGIVLGYFAFRVFAKIYVKIAKDSFSDSKGLSRFLLEVTSA